MVFYFNFSKLHLNRSKLRRCFFRNNVQFLQKGLSMRLKEVHEKRKLPAKTMLKRVDKNVPNLRERFF